MLKSLEFIKINSFDLQTRQVVSSLAKDILAQLFLVFNLINLWFVAACPSAEFSNPFSKRFQVKFDFQEKITFYLPPRQLHRLFNLRPFDLSIFFQ